MSQQFMDTMGPLALAISQQTGIDPRLVIAQSALETGWGQSAPGNNYFGIKSHGREGGNNLATTEVVNGQPVKINDSFRAYADPSESAADYANFLKTNPRYASVLNAKGLDDQIKAMGSSGYATDPNYAQKLQQIASGINMDTMTYTPAKLPAVSGQRGDTANPPQDTSYVNSLMKGGPLALFGYGQRGYDWGNALLGAAASLAAINSPAQGAVYASMIKKNDGDLDIQVDNQNGRVSIINKKTGEVRYSNDPNFLQRLRERKQIEAGAKAPAAKDVETFNAYKDYLDKTYDIADTARDLQETLKNNPGFGGWMSQAKAYLSAGFDDATKSFKPETVKALQDSNLLSTPEQQAFFAKLQKFRQDLVWAGLAKEKGVQTEGDAIRMGQKFFSSIGSMSGDQLYRDLDDIRGGALKDHSRAFSNYKGYVDRFGEYNPQFQGENALISRFTNQHSITSDALRRYEEEKRNRSNAPAPQANTGSSQRNVGYTILGN